MSVSNWGIPANMLLVPVFRSATYVEFLGWRIFIDGKEYKPEYMDETRVSSVESGLSPPKFLASAAPFFGPVVDYTKVVEERNSLASQGICKTK